MFELLDADGSNNISGDEFENFGFLFNFEASAVSQIFKEFDVSGDQVGRHVQCHGLGHVPVLLCMCRNWTIKNFACLQWHA